jgi:MerR family transcriptional regulator/heat shock protein HspR
MIERGESAVVTITVAARQSGVTSHTVRRYVRRGLVQTPLTEASLAELRRIRRLTDLGVNLAGVEVILRMRQRIVDLQREVDRLQALLDAADYR